MTLQFQLFSQYEDVRERDRPLIVQDEIYTGGLKGQRQVGQHFDQCEPFLHLRHIETEIGEPR
jgi:hypothetical protein